MAANRERKGAEVDSWKWDFGGREGGHQERLSRAQLLGRALGLDAAVLAPLFVGACTTSSSSGDDDDDDGMKRRRRKSVEGSAGGR
jgi:hypothetical protein